MLVSTAASSQNTRRSKSASVSSACHSTHPSRAARTSGRCCSAACSVFFTGQAQLLEGAADSGQRAGHVHPVADLLQREVGLVGQQLPEFVVAVLGDGGCMPAVVGSRLQGAGFLPEVQVVGDTVDG